MNIRCVHCNETINEDETHICKGELKDHYSSCDNCAFFDLGEMGGYCMKNRRDVWNSFTCDGFSKYVDPEIEIKTKINTVRNFLTSLEKNQQPLPPEIQKLINDDDFWNSI